MKRRRLQESLPNPREDSRIGPLSLKDPASVEYAWQLLARSKTCWQNTSGMLSSWRKVVGMIQEHKIYARIPDQKSPYGSIEAMFEAEGIPAEAIDIKDEKQFKELKRTQVAAREPTTGQRGKDGPRAKDNCTDSCQLGYRDRAKQNGVSRDTQYRLDRLARDFPRLHKQVCSGKLSVNRAAIQAGFVKEPTRLDRAMAAYSKLTEQEQQEFEDWWNETYASHLI